MAFSWSAPTTGSAFTLGFTIKNSQNQVVYTYSGSSADLADGIFYEDNNNCGNVAPEGVPTNCVAVLDDNDPNTINVSWDPIPGVSGGYGYIVYRDGRQHRMVPNGTSFVDENVPQGGHCYYVGYLGEGGENGYYSNESCATVGADCLAPTNIDYEYTGAAYKIKLKWNKPNPSTGLSGYYLFRKFGEDGEYTRIKLLSSSATSYTDNTATQEGDYYYKLYAYYSGIDCTSAPANWIWDSNQYYIKVLYSADGVNEVDGKDVSVFPNPTTNRFTVEGEDLNHVSVYNTLGQMVYDMDCHGESIDITLDNVETGIYMVRIATAKGMVTKRITVIK